MKQHRKYLDDIIEESYSTNSFSKAMKELRKYSLAALAVGALGFGGFLGGCGKGNEEVKLEPQKYIVRKY